MKLGLGIDTGGTYTDAVIYDFDEGKAVAWGKSPTTREDLTLGIAAALDTLPQESLKKVQRAALSTTLATNACVEGRGGKARMILIGCQRKIVGSVGMEYGLPPAEEIVFVDGGHDRQGKLSPTGRHWRLKFAVRILSGALMPWWKSGVRAIRKRRPEHGIC